MLTALAIGAYKYDQKIVVLFAAGFLWGATGAVMAFFLLFFGCVGVLTSVLVLRQWIRQHCRGPLVQWPPLKDDAEDVTDSEVQFAMLKDRLGAATATGQYRLFPKYIFSQVRRP